MKLDIKKAIYFPFSDDKHLVWLKKPIILSGLIYALYGALTYVWAIILVFIKKFSINLYKTFFKYSIAIDIVYSLAFLLAILLICIIYSAKYKEQLNKGHIFRISFYLALIQLFNIKLTENFAIPYADMSFPDLIINDILGLIIYFLGTFVILWVSSKIGYSLKDFPFNKIFQNKFINKIIRELFQIILIIILVIVAMLLKHYFNI